MSIQTLTIAKAAIATALLTASALPAYADALTSNFSFTIVETDPAGEEVFVDRDTVKPGEVIQYELVHENTTDGPMEGIVVAAPVPEGVTLSWDGAETSVDAVFEVQAELDPEADGLEWSTLPAVRLVADETGKLQEEPLPEEEVAAVRWTFSAPLEPGEPVVNSYRVRVN